MPIMPQVNNLMLCDYLSVDSNGKVSCCGIFENIRAATMPYPFSFYIYATLTAGKGKQQIRVEIENIFSGLKLADVKCDVDFNDPMRGLSVMLQMKVLIEESGQYAANIICGGHLLRSTKLNVYYKIQEDGARSENPGV